jgi:hypothetical protein
VASWENIREAIYPTVGDGKHQIIASVQGIVCPPWISALLDGQSK